MKFKKFLAVLSASLIFMISVFNDYTAEAMLGVRVIREMTPVITPPLEYGTPISSVEPDTKDITWDKRARLWARHADSIMRTCVVDNVRLEDRASNKLFSVVPQYYLCQIILKSKLNGKEKTIDFQPTKFLWARDMVTGMLRGEDCHEDFGHADMLSDPVCANYYERICATDDKKIEYLKSIYAERFGDMPFYCVDGCNYDHEKVFGMIEEIRKNIKSMREINPQIAKAMRFELLNFLARLFMCMHFKRVDEKQCTSETESRDCRHRFNMAMSQRMLELFLLKEISAKTCFGGSFYDVPGEYSCCAGAYNYNYHYITDFARILCQRGLA